MPVVIKNVAVAPVGPITQFAATIGALTAISGVQHTTFGQYRHVTANSAAGGVLFGFPASYTVITQAVNFLPTYAPVQFVPVAGAVNGVLVDVEMGAYRRQLIGRLLNATSPTPSIVPPFILILSMG